MSLTIDAPARPESGGSATVPPERRRSHVGRERSRIVHYATWIVATVLVVGPLVPVVWASLWTVPLYDDGGSFTLRNYRDLLTDAAWWTAVRNTVGFAVLTTAGAVALGTLLAVLLRRVQMPGARLYRTLILGPVVLPGLPLMLGWIAMYSPAGYVTSWIDSNTPLPIFWNLYSVPGMALVAIGSLTPLMYMVVGSALSTLDSTLENAARVNGASPVRALFSVTVPMLRPGILNAGVITFALSLEVVGIPLLLGTSSNIDFISTYLVDNWSNEFPPRQGLVSAGAVVLLAVMTVLLVLRNRFAGDLARFTTTTGKPTASRPIAIGRLRWPMTVLVGGYFLITLVIPAIGLLLTAFTTVLTPYIDPWDVATLDNFSTVLDNPVFRRSIVNSLLIATIGGAITTLAITTIALVAHRSRFRYRRSLQYVTLYPRAIPGIVTGMAFFWSFVVIDPNGVVRSSLWGIGIAFAVRSLALGYSAFYPALAALGEDLERAARVSGADWLTAMRTILVRLLRPAMAVSYVLLFVALFADYDPALFMVSPGNEVIGLTMLNLWITGVAGPVAALGVVQLVVTAVVLGAARLVFGRISNG
ncbi:MAG: ABC transporter permease [Acidimicrobiaceae bacterium]|nr:ABC transporter permease [Acidimicrobiaceae bacterium]